MDTPDGFDRAPDRYTSTGRETVDTMRDGARSLAALLTDRQPLSPTDLGDLLFLYACWTHQRKYEDRLGKKGTPEDAAKDADKARWWREMGAHVANPSNNPDPRANRADYTPYQRHTL